MQNKKTLNSIDQEVWDVVVIGAGAAGLMTCLELPTHLKILLLNRNTSSRSSSRWAQGGIASVTRKEDSFQSHAEDTLNAGAGLCDLNAVELLVEEAPNSVKRLQRLGMEFDRDSDGLATTLEAAHSFRRVLHVQDRTGRALVEVLRDQVESSSNILHRRGVRVTQLWVEEKTCKGVQVLDGECLYWISSRAVVLASGGGGHLFENTTNPPQACGEGLALAWKAGAAIEDLEFIQFHPTALKLKGAPCFLLSEALRGEGAVLVDQFGNSPVSHLPMQDLASRDQVSRALCDAMSAQGVNHIDLDLQKISNKNLDLRFPFIIQRCREFGLDPFQNLIPIAPAAHYWMGGIATNLNSATTLTGLYAVGEVACTGVHGANRLASNSLLECLVFARQLSSISLIDSIHKPKRVTFKVIDSNEDSLDSLSNKSLEESIEDLRRLCWKEAGVNRSEKGMKIALLDIQRDLSNINSHPLLSLLNNQDFDCNYRFNENHRRNLNLLIDLYHRQLTSILLFKACLFRKESRGGHFRKDIPTKIPFWKCHSRQVKGKDISTRPVIS